MVSTNCFTDKSDTAEKITPITEFVVDNRIRVIITKRPNVKFKSDNIENVSLAVIDGFENAFTHCGFFDVTALITFDHFYIDPNTKLIRKFHCKRFKNLRDNTIVFLLREAFAKTGLDMAFEIETTPLSKEQKEKEEPKTGFLSKFSFFQIQKERK